MTCGQLSSTDQTAAAAAAAAAACGLAADVANVVFNGGLPSNTPASPAVANSFPMTLARLPSLPTPHRMYTC
jgi:hypothetical protein